MSCFGKLYSIEQRMRALENGLDTCFRFCLLYSTSSKMNNYQGFRSDKRTPGERQRF
jgi:hypothetical protein